MRSLVMPVGALSVALAACAAFASCSPAQQEKPVAFADIPTEPAPIPQPGDKSSSFSLDRSQEGVVMGGSGIKVPDGGLAWCTTPSPEAVLSSTDLSPSTVLRVYSGGCVPSDGYYRACDDAGQTLYTTTCDAKNSGKRLEIVTSGKTAVALRADTVEVVAGPLSDGTWPIGSNGHALIVNTDARVGSGVERTMRVAATSYKTDDWHEPAEDFAEVAANPKTGFTFWRKAVCIDAIGCVIARWEANRGGIRLSTSEKDLYREARNRLKTDIPALKSKAVASACPSELLLAAVRMFTLSRLSGEAEPGALKEFDAYTAGLNTTSCPMTPTGKAKPVKGIRADMASAVRKLIDKKTLPSR
jgi:hypothetical protein